MQEFAFKVEREINMWVEREILQATPKWAHLMAYMASQPGMKWLRVFLPIVRYFTDVHIKQETNVVGGPGFRPGRGHMKKTIRLIKHGELIAEKVFDIGVVSG